MEEFLKEMNRRMDYLTQQILTLKKRVDTFIDELERRDKETINYIKKDMKEIRHKAKISPEPKTVVVDQDGEEHT